VPVVAVRVHLKEKDQEFYLNETSSTKLMLCYEYLVHFF
jgi:hypothetical protein